MNASVLADPATLAEIAAAQGVCIRPVLAQVIDTETGRPELVPIRCGATLALKCPPCAARARRLRMVQCREGWHLETEPESAAPAEKDESPVERRIRSTRRRQDVPDLPQLPMDDRTVGGTFTSPDGKTYRPSMFLTITLGSYGRVRPDGTPVDPDSYDYRRAALDAMHFPKVVDRLIQNLRRCAGFQVQYFAALEPQRRLAPHLHAAIRGVLPRQIVRQVVSATYHQVWWPPTDVVIHDQDHLPVWVDEAGYVDPTTGRPLPTWDEALDQLDADPDARPMHVVRLGRQLDLQGVLARTDKADRRIGYLTKYLGKSMADPIGEDSHSSHSQRRHLSRLHDQVRWLPCSPTCANWLRYGVQPANPAPGLVPGECRKKAHDRLHLGCGGRRALVSRKWTGKTLTDHRADRAEVVRQTLAAAGIDMTNHDRISARSVNADGQPRYLWSVVNPAKTRLPTYQHVITKSIEQTQRWRRQYDDAVQRAGPNPPAQQAIPQSPAA